MNLRLPHVRISVFCPLFFFFKFYFFNLSEILSEWRKRTLGTYLGVVDVLQLFAEAVAISMK